MTMLAQGGRGGAQPARIAEGGRADRSDRLLGVARHRGLALADGDAHQGRFGERADQPGGQADHEQLGSGEGRSRGQPVQGLRRAGDHARARPAAHHVAGRQHAQGRNRRRHADAAASFRFGSSADAGNAEQRRAGRDIRSRAGTPVSRPLAASCRSGSASARASARARSRSRRRT